MVTQAIPKWTVEAYLAYEEETGIRHDYLDGEIFAMAGGTEKHSLITANSMIELGQQLRNTPCRIHTSDMKIKINTATYVYPDFSVVCGTAKFADKKRTMLLNPTLLVEVMSPTTADYDRGSKGLFYRSLDSVQAYLLFEQERVYAQLYTRQTEGWLLREFSDINATIPLNVLNAVLRLEDVYRGIVFEKDEE